MEQVSGYARVIARARVEQQQNKPIFGKPYLKYGQCYALWSYFFQLGGILGAKHFANIDAFGTAFLGLRGESGAVKNFFAEVAKRILTEYELDSMKFADYVGKEFLGRVGHSGETNKFFLEHGMEKLPTETAAELAWQYADQGSALGATHPQVMREMFERTHVAVPKEEWEFARAVGLDISPEQVLMSYKEVEEAENKVFMAYCQECYPDLYSILDS